MLCSSFPLCNPLTGLNFPLFHYATLLTNYCAFPSYFILKTMFPFPCKFSPIYLCLHMWILLLYIAGIYVFTLFCIFSNYLYFLKTLRNQFNTSYIGIHTNLLTMCLLLYLILRYQVMENNTVIIILCVINRT